MKFRDIPQFTRDGEWECNYRISRISDTLKEWEKEYDLELNPDFQRGNVWSESQQISYIEFFLKGGKSARVIYFNCPWWNGGDRNNYKDMNMVCVDGLQRITAILQFVNNKIKAFGYYFNEFEDKPNDARMSIKFNVNDLQTREEVLQWYLDFNTGGTVHSQEEIDRVKKLLEVEKVKNKRGSINEDR